MKSLTAIAALTLAVSTVSIGCAKTPPPARTPVPAPGHPHVTRGTEREKPMPDVRTESDFGPLYDDQPLVNQRPPEQDAFVQAYRAVGQPKIAVFVNRTLEGDIVPVNPDVPISSVEHRQTATTGVSVERRDDYSREDRYWNQGDRRERTDSFKSEGPGEYRESTAVYLKPGEYDDVQAKAIDYEAMEAILTDWLSAEGQVTLMSPTMTRQRLSDDQVKELQSGRPTVLRELAERLDADILVQVQARPTKQTSEGLGVRVIVEAINTKGGQSLAREVVDVPPPLDKWQLNKYTRFLARKLMNGMGNSWMAPPPVRPEGAGPTTGPVPQAPAAPAAPAQPEQGPAAPSAASAPSAPTTK
jgi:hypothetical protein